MVECSLVLFPLLAIKICGNCICHRDCRWHGPQLSEVKVSWTAPLSLLPREALCTQQEVSQVVHWITKSQIGQDSYTLHSGFLLQFLFRFETSSVHFMSRKSDISQRPIDDLASKLINYLTSSVKKVPYCVKRCESISKFDRIAEHLESDFKNCSAILLNLHIESHLLTNNGTFLTLVVR